MKKTYSRVRALQRIRDARYGDPKDTKLILFTKEYSSVEYQPELSRLYEIRRDIKRIWNEEADHDFWQNPNDLQCVHWIGWHKNVQKGLAGLKEFFELNPPNIECNDELSTYGYYKTKPYRWGTEKIGVLLHKRRVTFAHCKDAWTEELHRTSDVHKQHFHSSGLPKRPTVAVGELGIYFVEEEIGSRGPNDLVGEVICDNWQWNTVVLIPSPFWDKSALLQITDYCQAKGLDILTGDYNKPKST